MAPRRYCPACGQAWPHASGRVPDGEYDAAQMLELTGVSYRQLDHWTRSGYLHSVDPPQGSGAPRRWSGREVIVAREMRTLIRAGLSVAVAAAHARDGIDDA